MSDSLIFQKNSIQLLVSIEKIITKYEYQKPLKTLFEGPIFCDEIYTANLSLVVLKSTGIVLVKSKTDKSRPSEAC